MSLQTLIENELDPYLIEIDEGTHYLNNLFKLYLKKVILKKMI